jgi:hypothetical protein
VSAGDCLPLLREIGAAFDDFPACFLWEFPFPCGNFALNVSSCAAAGLEDELMEDGGVGGKAEDDEGFGEF